MVTESIAILAITLCMIAIFVRSGRGDYALGVAPLLLVPLAHVVGHLAFRFLRLRALGFQLEVVLAFMDIAAVALSGLLIFAFSARIKSPKNKKLYIALVCGYNIILGCAYVYRTIAPLL